jgi:hypothetical protein
MSNEHKFDWSSEVDALGGFDPTFAPDLSADVMQEPLQSLIGGNKANLAGPRKTHHSALDSGVRDWILWYIDYANGKRTDDDQYYISKWKAFKAGQGGKFVKNPTPRQAFALRNWGIDPLKLIHDKRKREKVEAAMEEYRRKAEDKHVAKKAAFDRSELEAIAQFLNKKLGARLPMASGADAELEQAILDFVEGQGGVNAAVMAAGQQGLEDVQKYLNVSPSGLPSSPPAAEST